ncbi:MAG TPA: amidohydrolase family protein [Candidatus Dormibacteraeota bacterium]|nr:amidohydrolase family protein [Candidatus Dormibacteraeota bacterium]
MGYQLQVTAGGLTAIDVHVHLHRLDDGEGAGEAPNPAFNAARQKFHVQGPSPTLEETVAYFRERRMAAVIFNVDSETATGRRGVTGAQIVEAASRYPDVLIPFASVDPWKGRMAIEEAERLIAAGVRGFKFHPPGQAFYPNDRRFYPLYEVIAAAKLPALFHTGQTAIGASAARGGGMRMKYANPIYLDDLAVDFPDMPIIMAHPSFPWQDEALAVAVHKPQVYIDLSGWSPRYFPPQLVHYANTLLKEKVLYGSDYPLLTPDRWMQDFEQAPFRDEVRPLILKENAARLLGLPT